MMVSGEWRLLLVAVVLAVAGCGGGPPTVEVKGMVTYDGKPLKEGEIHFLDMEKGDPAKLLDIKVGSFSGQVTPGKKKVQIFAYKEAKAEGAAGYKPPPEEGTTKENYIPAQYNTESKLEDVVKAEGGNNFKYDLLSK
jgi:hypothetical protein